MRMVRWMCSVNDGVAPSRTVTVSAAVNLPLHHKVQKFCSGTGSPGWSWKKGHKWLWCGVVLEGTMQKLPEQVIVHNVCTIQ